MRKKIRNDNPATWLRFPGGGVVTVDYWKSVIKRLEDPGAVMSAFDRRVLEEFDDPKVVAARLAARAEKIISPEQQRAQAYRDAVVAALRPADITFRNAHLEALNRHAIDLVLQHNVRVHNCGLGGRACAHFETRTVDVPPVTSDESYATLIHELGHLLSPDGDSRQHAYRVERNPDALIAIGGECGAWKWAIDHALAWTKAMHTDLYRCMTHYAALALDQDERDEIALCVGESAFRICDRPVTFAELEAQQKTCRGAGGPVEDLSAAFGETVRQELQ